ncbi:hypothetical protein [Candidatus Tisiphia endosymbiont of Oplodontha viridula]|uniref:hypothetical protein n=1 Tax=Candidatus Tisiphia endosymbiont of Oplodontha viridula TaxID=3077925 RepID=UPI0035C932B4
MPLDQTIIQQIINNSITTLTLYNNQIGDAGAKSLAECLKDNNSITILYLYNNQIGDAEAKSLAECLKDNKSITQVTINNN